MPEVDNAALRTALRLHTTSTGYLKSLAQGSQRFDLGSEAAGGHRRSSGAGRHRIARAFRFRKAPEPMRRLAAIRRNPEELARGSVAADLVVGKEIRSPDTEPFGKDRRLRARLPRPPLGAEGQADTGSPSRLDGYPSTFQFVVDALTREWYVIAPDWRGSHRLAGQPYWFPDYLADLDALLRRYLPEEPARIVGHSMGASIAATYAGVPAGPGGSTGHARFPRTAAGPGRNPGASRPLAGRGWPRRPNHAPTPITAIWLGVCVLSIRGSPRSEPIFSRRIGMAEPGAGSPGLRSLAPRAFRPVPDRGGDGVLALGYCAGAPSGRDQGFVVQRFAGSPTNWLSAWLALPPLEREEIPDCRP